jgi:DNA-binding Xre family transcriptional regulator
MQPAPAVAAGANSGLSHSGDTLATRNVPRPTLVRVPALLHWRMQRGVTQLQLAERSGVGRATIARLENNGEARLSTVGRLAAALEIKPPDLMKDQQ